MIFQVSLILALGLLTLYACLQWRKAPAVSAAVLALTLTGMVLGVAPDLATRVAHLVGIGRGADLVIYCFILIALVALFNLHLRFRASEANLTKIVRAFALLSAHTTNAPRRDGAADSDATRDKASRT